MFLSGALSNSAISAVLTTVTGLPASLPYTLILDPGLTTEEVVEATAIGGTTVTITRGMDGTSGQAHSSGAEVRHGFSARDFQDSRNHEANTATAHGVTGTVVGTTNTQTLTGKTISGASNTLSAIPIGAVTNGVDLASVQTLTNKTMSGGLNTFSAIPIGAVTNGVDLGSAQVLTNKTMSGASNTLSAIPIGAVTNGVDLASTQTLTNKSISGSTNTLTSIPDSALATGKMGNLVTPASVAGSGVTVAGGKVSFAAATNISANGCFTSTYDVYLIELEIDSASGSSDVNINMRLSGTDNIVNMKWGSQQVSYGTGAQTGTGAAAAGSILIGRADTVGGASTATIYAPNLATRTKVTASSADNSVARSSSGFVNDSAQYDGFSISPTSGNIAGTLRVYGYNNG
jgi:hypothetical protein